jgi:hypothetical protein
MQPAKDRVGMDGTRISAAMTPIVVSLVKIGYGGSGTHRVPRPHGLLLCRLARVK